MLLLLLACTAGKDTPVSPPDDTGYAHVDTSAVPDSEASTPTETDSDSTLPPDDTGDSSPVSPSWVVLDVYPVSLFVNPDAVFRARAVGTRSDGSRGDVAVSWSSNNEDVVTVDAAGSVIALEPGTALLTGTVDGLSGTISVEVDDAYEAEVTVVDARTGAPIPGARVALPGTTGEHTDAAGAARLPVPDGLPVDFSVWVDENWDAVSFLQVVNRRFVVGLAPADTVVTDATLHGTVDYGAVGDAAWDEIVLGLAAPAVPSLATMTLEDWFSAERPVKVFGFETELPANLVVEGEAGDFSVDTLAGPAGAWMLAGPLKITDVSGATGSTGAALALLISHLDAMRWGWGGGVTTVAEATTEIGLTPAASFDQSTVVALPPLPAGFTGAEEVLVMTAEERADEGFFVTGFALGVGDAVAVTHADGGGVADSLGTSVVAYAQAGGLGGTGGISVAAGRVDTLGNGVLADFLDLPLVPTWQPSTRALAVDVDPDADFVHVLLTDPHHLRHHLYVGGDWSGTLPNTIADFGRASASLEVDAVATDEDTFEARVGLSRLEVRSLPAHAASHMRQE